MGKVVLQQFLLSFGQLSNEEVTNIIHYRKCGFFSIIRIQMPDFVSLATSNANFVADLRSIGFIFQFPAINFGKRVVLAKTLSKIKYDETNNKIETMFLMLTVRIMSASLRNIDIVGILQYVLHYNV